MKIDEVLKEFIDECSEKLDLKCIMQFGSSTYSDNPHDIDLLLFSNQKVFSTIDYVNLFKVIESFENLNKEIVFDIGGGWRNKKTDYNISITPLQILDLDLNTDAFFLKNISEDENKKILFGKNPINNKIKLNNKEIAKRLGQEINHHLRGCLEKETKLESLYSLFKVTLRLMLVNEGIPKKEELIEKFKQEFKINLPKNANKILKREIIENDFEEILKFSETCLNWLVK